MEALFIRAFFIFLKKFFTSIYVYVILYMWSVKDKELKERRIVNEPQKKQSKSRQREILP